jgi:Trypsin-like peptidase domain/Double zinc ribbon
MATSMRISWTPDVSRLRNWFYLYLVLWGSGLIVAFAVPSEDFTPGIYILLLAVVPYIVCIVYSYRVQDRLHRAGLYGHGAWHVLVGALLLNPFVLGLLIPVSVLWTAHRIGRKVNRASGQNSAATTEGLRGDPGRASPSASPPHADTAGRASGTGTKRCPWCAEEIQEAALICRFCNRDLSDVPKQTPPVAGRLCPKCRTPVVEDQAFCPKCGNDLRKTTHHRARTVGIASGVVIAGALVGFWLFLRPSSAAQWSSSVASLHVLDANGNALAQGSGFLINDSGDLATNFHVVGGGEKVRVEFPGGVVTETSTLVGADEYLDLAILKTDLRGLAPLSLADRQPQVGDEVTVLGSPLGLTNTLSKGVVSGIRTFAGTDLYQITAPISPGSSGGPVLDHRGRVIGLATASLTIGQNLNFAVPAAHLRHLIGTETRELRLLGRAATGIGLMEVANQLESVSDGWSDSLARNSFDQFRSGLSGENKSGGLDAIYVGKSKSGYWFLFSVMQTTPGTAFGAYCVTNSSPTAWSSHELCRFSLPFKAVLYRGGHFVGTVKAFTDYDSISVNTRSPDIWGYAGGDVLTATWHLSFSDTLVGLYALGIPSSPSSVTGVWDILYPDPDRQGLQGRMVVFQNGAEVIGLWMQQSYSPYLNRIVWTQMSTVSGSISGTTITFHPNSYVLTCQGQVQADGMTGTCTSQLKSGQVSRERFDATRRAR